MLKPPFWPGETPDSRGHQGGFGYRCRGRILAVHALSHARRGAGLEESSISMLGSDRSWGGHMENHHFYSWVNQLFLYFYGPWLQIRSEELPEGKLENPLAIHWGFHFDGVPQ